jgi:hypothetical protein
MLPLLKVTNHRLPLDDIRISVVDNRRSMPPAPATANIT